MTLSDVGMPPTMMAMGETRKGGDIVGGCARDRGRTDPWCGAGRRWAAAGRFAADRPISSRA